MIISALDKDTVKLITTTQIITSISTAVKELLENAFDADAKNVEINLVCHAFLFTQHIFIFQLFLDFVNFH